MNQLKAMLETHPEGLRRAEIARRLGVHRSTVGRYINQLSLSLQVWERDSRIGLENVDSEKNSQVFDIYEGTFLLLLLKLYEKELNTKNPHASSFIRKISGNYRKTAPLLYENLLQKAELFEIEEKRYSRGENDAFEKMTEASNNRNVVKINYLHKITGESCSTLYEPLQFFISRKRGHITNVAVCGLCGRTGERCALYLQDFAEIESLPPNGVLAGEGDFCPVSEYARGGRPSKKDNDNEDYCIKEANHRIKNSLFMTSGLIDIAFADNQEQAVADKLKGLQSRIDAIAEVHGQLSENDGSSLIQLDRYLSRLVSKNLTALSPDPSAVKTRLQVDEILLDAGKVIPLGMIINELVANSFKHAMRSESSIISLNVTKCNGMISVRYGDGENKAYLMGQDGRTGYKLINGFCKQLGCEVTYKNKYILLEFPA